MNEAKKQFPKDDMHYAALICGNKMSEIAELEDRKKRQRTLFNAGVAGVPDPDREPQSIAEAIFGMRGPLDHKEMDRMQLGHLLTITKPKRTVIDSIINQENDLLYFGLLAEDEERCGYCNKIKKKGDWCENYRCKSNKKRRGEL